MRALLLLLFSLSAFAQGRINAGGPAFTDALGQVWQSDQYFSRGGVASFAVSAGVPGYYGTARFGNFSYAIPVPNGKYAVSLGFLENEVNAGGRVFTVSINGVVVLPSYDIAADVGRNVPVRKSFVTTLTGGTGLKLLFATSVRAGRVNSIEFSLIPDVGAPPCEIGFGVGNPLFQFPVGVYAMWQCENRTGGPLLITGIQCRSDVAGVVVDVQSRRPDKSYVSVLTVPMVCPPDGVEGVVAAGASYPAGDPLWFFVRTTDPTMSQVTVHVDLAKASGATLQGLERCTGSVSCAGLYRANVAIGGSRLSIVGPDMAVEGTWEVVK